MLKEHEDNMKVFLKGVFQSLNEYERVSDRDISGRFDYKIKNQRVLESLESLRINNKVNTSEASYVIMKESGIKSVDMRLMKKKLYG